MIPAIVLAGWLVAGDCIALGTGGAMHVRTDAKMGIQAAAVVARAKPRGASVVIVSAGSNDLPHGLSPSQASRGRARIAVALASILKNAGRARVVFILPANAARQPVASFASAHGIAVVGFRAGRDRIHPLSYRRLAADLRKKIGK